jgi:hypothetical protein
MMGENYRGGWEGGASCIAHTSLGDFLPLQWYYNIFASLALPVVLPYLLLHQPLIRPNSSRDNARGEVEEYLCAAMSGADTMEEMLKDEGWGMGIIVAVTEEERVWYVSTSSFSFSLQQ